MDLRTYLTAIRKGWWLVLTIAVLAGAIGAFLTYHATPIYAASLRFYISTPITTNSSALSTDQFAQDRASSYAELLSSDRLAVMIIESAKLKMTPNRVAAEISATAQLNTVLVNATVSDPSAKRALEIATAAATQFPKMVNQLDNIGSKKTNVSLSVVSGPMVGSTPVSPRKKLTISLALLIGLFIGLMAAVLRQVLDNSINGVEIVEEIAGAPVLATIGYDASAKEAPLLVEDAAHSPRAEAFRRLRTNLQFIHAAQRLNVIVVTSSVETEGKSTTACNLAIVMVESGTRVLLIEADLRRPKIADYLGLERAVGLTNVLARQASVDDVLQSWGANNLSVLVSGSLPPNPSELLGSPRMAELLSDLRTRFDLIIIDTPPLLPVTDAAVLATQSDGVAIVVRHGKTKRAQLGASVRALEAVDAQILGAVLNMRPIRGADKRAYGSAGDYAEPTRTDVAEITLKDSDPDSKYDALPSHDSALADVDSESDDQDPDERVVVRSGPHRLYYFG